MRKVVAQQDGFAVLTGTSSRMRSLPVADVSRTLFHSEAPQPMQPPLIRPDPSVIPVADTADVVLNRKCVYTYEDKYTFARILVSDSLIFGESIHIPKILRSCFLSYLIKHLLFHCNRQTHTLRVVISTVLSGCSQISKQPQRLLSGLKTTYTICTYIMMYILLDTRNGMGPEVITFISSEFLKLST